MPPRSLGFLSVAGAATLWGVSGTVAKSLFRADIAPLVLVHIRMALSSLLLLAAFAVFDRTRLRVRRDEWLHLAVLGVVGLAMVQFTYFFAISESNVATAVFLQYLSPIFVALYSRFARQERLGPVVSAGIALALGGAAMLVFGGGPGSVKLTPLGVASGLASAVFMAFYTLYAQATVRRVDAWTALAYGLLFGAVFWTIVRGPATLLEWSFTATTWAWFGFIAVFATIIPFGLYFAGLRALSSTETTIIAMLEPVVAGLAAFVVLGETLTLRQVAGAACIVAAVTWIQTGRRPVAKEMAS